MCMYFLIFYSLMMTKELGSLEKVICLEFKNVFFSLEPDVHQTPKGQEKRKEISGDKVWMFVCECVRIGFTIYHPGT